MENYLLYFYSHDVTKEQKLNQKTHTLHALHKCMHELY